MNFQENNNNKKHVNTFLKPFICIVYVPKYNYAKNNHKPERTVRKIRASIWEEWNKSHRVEALKHKTECVVKKQSTHVQI